MLKLQTTYFNYRRGPLSYLLKSQIFFEKYSETGDFVLNTLFPGSLPPEVHFQLNNKRTESRFLRVLGVENRITDQLGLVFVQYIFVHLDCSPDLQISLEDQCTN